MFYKKYQLMYCSNIFKNSNQKQLIKNINKLSKIIKSKFVKKKTISIGLCLSNKLSHEIIKKKYILKNIIDNKNILISSINGFVYNTFHRKIVKDKIYWPDWTSKKRINYTKNLINIIKKIKNKKYIGSISTMPISYKPWIKTKKNTYIFYKSSKNLIKAINNIKQKIILSIEPEPSCLIENSNEFIFYFKNWLKPIYKIKNKNTKYINKHIGICYDICHFSVAFEKHKKILDSLKKENIIIGKLQVSSALKILGANEKNFKIKYLESFNKSPFLHQTSCIYNNKTKIYKDVKYAIKNIKNKIISEWRIHCHIPIYLKKYKSFKTTNNEIIEVFNKIRKNKFTKHVEIETYAYKNLQIKYNIFNSILKEYKWLRNIIKNVK